jgi:hypothetical protein
MGYTARGCNDAWRKKTLFHVSLFLVRDTRASPFQHTLAWMYQQCAAQTLSGARRTMSEHFPLPDIHKTTIFP